MSDWLLNDPVPEGIKLRKLPYVDGRPSKWGMAIDEIEHYWDGMVGKSGAGGQFCIAVSVFTLGILFALAMPWFVTVSLKRAIIG